MRWTRDLFKAMRPFSAEGAYVNYLGGDEGLDGLRAAYGTKLTRLMTLKTKYDSANLFRMNQNIVPPRWLERVHDQTADHELSS